MEIVELKKFLTNLTPISHMQYQIWDAKGNILFPSQAEMPNNPRFVEELRKLSRNVIGQNRFRHGYFADKNFVCGFPLSNGQATTGALTAFYPEPDMHKAKSPDNADKGTSALKMENFLGSLAEMVQTSWEAQGEVQELAEELEQSFEDLHLYGKISSQVKALKFSNTMLRDLITDLLNNLRADAAFAILSEYQDFDTLVTQPDLDDRLKKDLTFYRNLIENLPADALSVKDKYFVLNDSSADASYQKFWPETYRFLCVRVEHEEGFYGWLGLISFNMQEIFRQGELQLMASLAEQLSVVIANTGLYQDLEYFIINMVKSLVFAIEAKDPYTRGHSERVSKLSMRLGRALGVKGKELEALRWASILHDTGKIGISGSILNKQGPLNEDEYDAIKEHPMKGYEILKPVIQMEESLPGVLHHHERFAGNGYPGGLKGAEIPYHARIIAVADTFDAITSTRAYRSAKSPNKAMAIIKDVSGMQLDPQIASVFKTIVDEDGFLEMEPKYAK